MAVYECFGLTCFFARKLDWNFKYFMSKRANNEFIFLAVEGDASDIWTAGTWECCAVNFEL